MGIWTGPIQAQGLYFAAQGSHLDAYAAYAVFAAYCCPGAVALGPGGVDLGLTWALGMLTWVELGLTWALGVLTWLDLGLTWALWVLTWVYLGLTWALGVLTWLDLGLTWALGWLTWAKSTPSRPKSTPPMPKSTQANLIAQATE